MADAGDDRMGGEEGRLGGGGLGEGRLGGGGLGEGRLGGGGLGEGRLGGGGLGESLSKYQTTSYSSYRNLSKESLMKK